MTNREKAEELVHAWHSADLVGGISLSRTAREALIISIQGAIDRAVDDATRRAVAVCDDETSSTGRHLAERIRASCCHIEDSQMAAAFGEAATHMRSLRQISSAVHSLIAHARDVDEKLSEALDLAQTTEAHTPKHLRPALPCVGMPHEWAKWISEDGEESFECQRCGETTALCEACEDGPANPGDAICRECAAMAICSVCGGTGRLSKSTYGIVEDIECAKCRGTGEDS